MNWALFVQALGYLAWPLTVVFVTVWAGRRVKFWQRLDGLLDSWRIKRLKAGPFEAEMELQAQAQAAQLPPAPAEAREEVRKQLGPAVEEARELALGFLAQDQPSVTSAEVMEAMHQVRGLGPSRVPSGIVRELMRELNVDDKEELAFLLEELNVSIRREMEALYREARGTEPTDFPGVLSLSRQLGSMKLVEPWFDDALFRALRANPRAQKSLTFGVFHAQTLQTLLAHLRGWRNALAAGRKSD